MNDQGRDDGVKLFDLGPAVEEISSRLFERWREIVDEAAFVGGPAVERFETAWSDYLGTAGAVGVANGTDALVVSLRALGVGAGDEVIVPALTFFATAEAVILVGATPVVADVDDSTLTLDPDAAAAKVTERTVGVIGVHLYGHPFDVDAVGSLCSDRGLWLVEDAAQAHGARWRGRRVGGVGRLAGWSFYPSKNLGCFGDGGAVTGDDPELLAAVRCIGNHGRVEHTRHALVGTNSRLDGLQAAVLDLRLETLDAANRRRRAIAERYRNGLENVGDLRFQGVDPEAEPVWHQFTVRTGRRDGLRSHLESRGVGTGIFYPEPLHRMAALAPFLDEDLSLTVSEAATAEVLSLPMYPQLSDEEVDRVIEAVGSFYG